jgi:hypothetical protein
LDPRSVRGVSQKGQQLGDQLVASAQGSARVPQAKRGRHRTGEGRRHRFRTVSRLRCRRHLPGVVNGTGGIHSFGVVAEPPGGIDTRHVDPGVAVELLLPYPDAEELVFPQGGVPLEDHVFEDALRNHQYEVGALGAGQGPAHRSGVDQPADHHDSLPGETVSGPVRHTLMDRDAQPDPGVRQPWGVDPGQGRVQMAHKVIHHPRLGGAQRNQRQLLIALALGEPARPVQVRGRGGEFEEPQQLVLDLGLRPIVGGSIALDVNA